MARHFAVIGDPISQSLSPKIHSAAYKVLGIDWDFEAVRVSAGQVRQFLSDTVKFSGLSVTMPLKFEAFAASNKLDDGALRTGVVNTLVKTDSGYSGFNTDIFGIAQAIRNVATRSIAVLGSGATARSAVEAIVSTRPDSEIICYARNEMSLGQINTTYACLIETKPLHDYSGREDLTINTIPNYKPEKFNVLLSTSYGDGHLGQSEISGTEMLLWQALAQLRIYINGSQDEHLDDEGQIFAAMRGSLTEQ